LNSVERLGKESRKREAKRLHVCGIDRRPKENARNRPRSRDSGGWKSAGALTSRKGIRVTLGATVLRAGGLEKEKSECQRSEVVGLAK